MSIRTRLGRYLLGESAQTSRQSVRQAGASGTHVLVLGKAKTGTTFLSKVIQNSLAPCDYALEPKDVAFFHELFEQGRTGNIVVKILYEHWDRTPHLRNALLANELPLKFHKKVLIVRDPRDELISRLLYIVKPLKDQGRLTPEKLQAWLAVLRQKENDPASISVVEMIERLDGIFGSNFLSGFQKALDVFTGFYHHKPPDIFAIRYEDVVDQKVEKLEEYLGFSLNFALVEDEYISRTKRTGSYGAWKSIFLPADVAALTDIMTPFMNHIGYNCWELEPAEALDKQHVSDYVTRLVSVK
ncbi:MAG: sulfotransferase domain-containing protein [Pseudomonadota bacterium]